MLKTRIALVIIQLFSFKIKFRLFKKGINKT